ncbi:hypothetical protein KC19_8G010700 [Ceratodon purpureus]|uniref:Uncharacterized protein n=1 Tax=Ceratodon purpureus TaxID=3225 RepID=A0A8T0GXN4_CERPU|nr:hypothetical protein KC19_8G010700 [Ceratodon purpureus]
MTRESGSNPIVSHKVKTPDIDAIAPARSESDMHQNYRPFLPPQPPRHQRPQPHPNPKSTERDLSIIKPSQTNHLQFTTAKHLYNRSQRTKPILSYKPIPIIPPTQTRNIDANSDDGYPTQRSTWSLVGRHPNRKNPPKTPNQ